MEENKEESLKEIMFKKKVGFMLEKLEKVNKSLERIVQSIKDEKFSEFDKLNLQRTESLLINIEFANETVDDFGRIALTDFIEEANSLISEIQEVVFKKDENITYMTSQFEKYKEAYRYAHEDFKLALGQQ